MRRTSTHLCNGQRIMTPRVLVLLAVLSLLAGYRAVGVWNVQNKNWMVIQDSSQLLSTMKPIPPYPFIKKPQGNNWTLWDGHSVLFDDFHFAPCRWVNYVVNPYYYRQRPTHSIKTTLQSIPICIHPSPDIVSDNIANSGNWGDCSVLTEMWDIRQGINRETILFGKRPQLVHIEVGANIGACVLDLLLTTPEINIVAFEPNPINLFRLTSTLSKLFADHPEYRTRVQLFPIGLGTAAKAAKIYGSKTNLEHSTVGKTVTQNEGEQFTSAFPMYLERFDDLIDSHHPHTDFAVMKLDAQGYECNIMMAMSKMLDKVKMVSFEFDTHLLNEFGCPPGQMWDDLVHHHNLQMYTRDFLLLPHNPIPANFTKPNLQLDLLAVRTGMKLPMPRGTPLEEYMQQLRQRYKT